MFYYVVNRNEFAQTPLHAACVSGSMEIVQRLVQGGADTSAQDAAEDTPFHEACRHQYENIVVSIRLFFIFSGVRCERGVLMVINAGRGLFVLSSGF